ncbi:MAG: hypothetical protein R6V49_00020 [Bacteroidales bacterium]
MIKPVFHHGLFFAGNFGNAPPNIVTQISYFHITEGYPHSIPSGLGDGIPYNHEVVKKG